MMHALQLVWLVKRHIQDKAMRISEEIKPVASAISELCICLSKSISQIVSQTVSYKSVS